MWCRSLFFFRNAGKQAKPIRFPSKGRSGVSGKAYIEGCFIVSSGDMGVLFCLKRHPRMSLGQRRADRYVIHGSPLAGPPAALNKPYFSARLKTVVVRRNTTSCDAI